MEEIIARKGKEVKNIYYQSIGFLIGTLVTTTITLYKSLTSSGGEFIFWVIMGGFCIIASMGMTREWFDTAKLLSNKLKYLQEPQVIEGILLPAPNDEEWKRKETVDMESWAKNMRANHDPFYGVTRYYYNQHIVINSGDRGEIKFKDKLIPKTPEIEKYIKIVVEFQNEKEAILAKRATQQKLIEQKEEEKKQLEQIARESWE